MSGQTLTDRIAAAQYQLTGSDMARAVCKATTHEVMAPKKKHLECKCAHLHSSTILHCTALVCGASLLLTRPPPSTLSNHEGALSRRRRRRRWRLVILISAFS